MSRVEQRSVVKFDHLPARPLKGPQGSHLSERASVAGACLARKVARVDATPPCLRGHPAPAQGLVRARDLIPSEKGCEGRVAALPSSRATRPAPRNFLRRS